MRLNVNPQYDQKIRDVHNRQSNLISDETEMLLSFLLDMHNVCDGEIYFEDNDSRLKDIPYYEKALKRLNTDGFFITYKPDVTGGYEIELSEKALAYHKDQKHNKESTSNVTNIYISGNVNDSNLSTSTNSNQTLSNANQNQSNNKKTLFEKYWFPLIITLIGIIGTIIAAIIK